jgi:hypothetical protein
MNPTSKFKEDFNMTNGHYWSSSPDHVSEYGVRYLDVADDYIGPHGYGYRHFNARVRCIKNDTSA